MYNPCEDCQVVDCKNCEFNLIRKDYEELEIKFFNLQKQLSDCTLKLQAESRANRNKFNNDN